MKAGLYRAALEKNYEFHIKHVCFLMKMILLLNQLEILKCNLGYTQLNITMQEAYSDDVSIKLGIYCNLHKIDILL